MKAVSTSSGTLEKMKSMTQKPHGPLAYMVSAGLQKVSMWEKVVKFTIRWGIVRSMPKKLKVQRKKFQAAKAGFQSKGFRSFITRVPMVIIKKYNIQATTGTVGQVFRANSK